MSNVEITYLLNKFSWQRPFQSKQLRGISTLNAVKLVTIENLTHYKIQNFPLDK